jgi:hypothetical protein
MIVENADAPVLPGLSTAMSHAHDEMTVIETTDAA